VPTSSRTVVLVFATLWGLLATAFIAHTAGRRRLTRAAAALLLVEVLDVSFSDLGRQAFSPVAHAFGICAVAIVPAGSLALLVIAARRP
jgi:hypothetical protein